MKEFTQKKLKKAFDIILDALIIIALISSTTVAVIVTVRRMKNGFAGYGTIQSESMTASGLNVGDIVKVRPQDEYALGDVIVFYRAPEYYDKTFDKDAMQSYQIWIHEIIDIRADTLGRTTYLTKGSSNATDDGAYVPQDFVLGKASKLRDSTIGFINFICSVKGIILLVEIPCGLVLIYLICDLVMFLTKNKKETATEENK